MATSDERPDVELRLPADGAYVSVLRTTTAGLAARLDFTVDDIEDIRMAVGEASALVLDGARADGDLIARFWLEQARLVVAVAAESADPAPPAPDSFGWMVLSTLTDEVSATTSDGAVEITLAAGATPLDPQVGRPRAGQ